MKILTLIFSLVLIGVLATSCGSSPSNPGVDGGGRGPGTPGAPDGRGGEEGRSYFANVDAASKAKSGEALIAERFYITMSRLSVFALICDANNERKDSTKVSRLWNASTKLQKTAETVYGGQKPAYNRLEKQRNIESNRLSFEFGPPACQNSATEFRRLVGLSASDLEILIRTTPYGQL